MKSPFIARPRAPLSLFAPLAAVVLVSACGGGGGGSSEPSFSDGAAFLPAVESGERSEPSSEPPEVVIPPIASFPPAPPSDASTGDVLGSRFYASTPNAALLEVSSLGRRVAVNADIARSVPFIASDTSENLLLKNVRVLETSSDDDVSIVLAIENVGTQRACTVFVSGVSPLASDGRKLGRSFGLTFVDGSVVKNSLGVAQGGCIEPGTVAYAVGEASGVDAEVAAVHVARVFPLAQIGNGTPYDGALEIAGYRRESSDTLALDVVNTSSQPLVLDSVELFLLDENGQVVHVALDGFGGDFRGIGAGETESVRGRIGDFDGTAMSVRAVVRFEPVDD